MSALRQKLQVTQQTFDEIAELLLNAGHSHRLGPGLKWPIVLDGLEIEPAFEAIDMGSEAPPVFTPKKR